jgi:prolyl-tRNA synthetase
MKDMYSFDITRDDALRTYQHVVGAYKRILAQLELDYVIAAGTYHCVIVCACSSRSPLTHHHHPADSGNIGGDHSHEFHVMANIGEDTILRYSQKNINTIYYIYYLILICNI